MSASGFTLSTPTGQQVVVNQTATTTYQEGPNPSSESAVAVGTPILALGTTSGQPSRPP
jgi:hypothetical protein